MRARWYVILVLSGVVVTLVSQTETFSWLAITVGTVLGISGLAGISRNFFLQRRERRERRSADLSRIRR